MSPTDRGANTGIVEKPPTERQRHSFRRPVPDEPRGAWANRPFRAADTELRRWVPPVISLLVFVAGLIDIVSVVTRADSSRLHAIAAIFSGAIVRSATAASVVAGLLLVLLSVALRKRKRRAWRGAMALLVGSAVFSIVKGLYVGEAALALVVASLLFVYRDEFRAKSDPRSRVRAVGVFVGFLAVSVVIGMLFVNLRISHFVGSHSLGQQLQHVLLGLVGIEGPLRFRSERIDDLVGRVTLALGLVTLITPVYLLFRPAEPVSRLSPEDESRMRGLLDRYGCEDSLGYFALRRDKSVVWSPSGKSAVAYRVVSGVMLASGDPLGDVEAWPGAIARFLDIAREHGWTPAVMGCSEQGGTAWGRAGLDALELGDEAVVEVADFSLDGRSMRNVRQAVARVERAGYVFEMRRAKDIPADELIAIRASVKSWRGQETERGFSMALGRINATDDGDAVIATARKDGNLGALLHFVPWGRDGLSLDLMVRNRAADNGINEFVITSVLQQAADLGVVRVSLNFAVFRAALARGERLGAGFVLRLWCNVLLLASRWFQIESLYRFNAKFRPEWVPRYVCYPIARDLPRIAVAALEAEAFIVWPRLRVPFRRPPGRDQVVAGRRTGG